MNNESNILSLFLKNIPSYVKKRNDDDSLIEPKIKIKLLCNWCSSRDLSNFWNKMSKGNYTWNNITLILNDDEPDYWVVINGISKENLIKENQKNFDIKRTILFRMEPNMLNNKFWGEWCVPDHKDFFLKIFRHERINEIPGDFNNCEWHVSLTYNQLSNSVFEKTCSELSTVLSAKYSDIGQVKRINFVKFLESKGMVVHVYGDNKWNYKNFKGSLPYHCKNNALIPYKYTFNCENHFITNYFTEKLIDGILCECLVFYGGCPNVALYIDSKAFVQLSLSNFEKDYRIVEQCIRENLYERRLPYIKAMKNKILNELQFFPRLEKYFKSIGRI